MGWGFFPLQSQTQVLQQLPCIFVAMINGSRVCQQIFCCPFSRENGFKGRVVFPFLHTAMRWGKLLQCESGKAPVSLGMSSPCLGLGRGAGLGCPAVDAAQQPLPARSQPLLGEEGSRKMYMSGNYDEFELRVLFKPYFICSPYSRLVVVKNQHIVPADGDGQHKAGREANRQQEITESWNSPDWKGPLNVF